MYDKINKYVSSDDNYVYGFSYQKQLSPIANFSLHKLCL